MGFFKKNNQQTNTAPEGTTQVTDPSLLKALGISQPTNDTPKQNITILNNNKGNVNNVGAINETQSYNDPTVNTFMNSFSPYTNSDGSSYRKSNAFTTFSSQFLGSDQNSYDEDATFSQVYKNNVYNMTDKLSFYNYVDDDLKNSDFTQVSDLYDKMVQQNRLIPGYSPYKDVKTFNSFKNAGESMGMDDSDIVKTYGELKTVAFNTTLQQYTKNTFAATPAIQQLASGDFKTTIKNLQPNIYDNMSKNGIFSNSAATAATGALGAYFENMDLTSYKNIGEVAVDPNINNFTKTIIGNNYVEYVKSGQDPKQFMEQLPVQVVENFTSNLVYDPKTNKATLYNYSPYLNQYKNLHDVDFWNKQEDIAGGWSNGLFTFADGRTTEYAQQFLGDSLSGNVYNYLYDNKDDRSQINTDRLTKVQDAYNGTFGTNVDFTNKNAVNNLIHNVNSLPDSDKITAKNELANSDLGYLMSDIVNDKRVQSMSSSAYTNYEISTGGTTKGMLMNPIHSAAYGVSYLGSELSNASTMLYQGFKTSIKTQAGTNDARVDYQRENNVGEYANSNFMTATDEANQLKTEIAKAGGDSKTVIDNYTKKAVGTASDYTTMLQAMDEAKIEAYDAGEKAVQEHADETGFFGIGDLFNLSDGNNDYRQKAYNEQLRKSMVDKIGEDKVKELEKHGSLESMANHNSIDYLDDYKSHVDNVFKQTLTTDQYNDLKKDLSDNKVVKSVKDDYMQRVQTRHQAMTEAFVPFANNRGRTEEGLRGYTNAYNAAVDNTGELNDLIVEIGLDPSNLISFGGKTAAETGVRSLHAATTGLGKGTVKTVTTRGGLTKNVAEAYNENIASQASKQLSESISDRLKGGLYQSTIKRNSDRLLNNASTLDDLNDNLITDLGDIMDSEFDPITVDNIKSELRNFSNQYTIYAQQMGNLHGIIDEGSEKYKNVFKYSRTDRDDAFEVLKRSNEDAKLLNDKMIGTVNDHRTALNNIYESLDNDSILKARLGQYNQGLDDIITSDQQMRKYFTNNIQAGESMPKYLEKTFNNMFANNTTYQGVHGKTVLNNLIKNSDTIGDSIEKYVHTDSMDINDLSALLHKNINYDGKFTTEGARRQVSNSIHDLAKVVDTHLVDRSPAIDRMFDIHLDDTIPEESKNILTNLVGDRTEVSSDYTMINEDIINEIFSQNGFEDGIKNIMNDYTKTRLLDGDVYDLEGALREHFNNTTGKYKRAVNALNKELDPVQTSIAFHHDRGVLYDLSKDYVHELAAKHMPDYSTFLENNKPQVIKKIKEDLGLPTNIANNKLVDKINEVNGFNDGDLSTFTILNQLDGGNFKGEYKKLVDDISNGTTDVNDKLLTVFYDNVTKKDIINKLDGRFHFLGEEGSKGSKLIKQTRNNFSRLTKNDIVSYIGTRTLINLFKDDFVGSYDNVINKLSGTDIKNMFPQVYKNVEQTLKMRQSSGLVKPVTSLDDILQGVQLGGDFSIASYIDGVTPYAFQENIDNLEKLKEYHALTSTLMLDSRRKANALGRGGEYQKMAFQRLANLYNSVGKQPGEHVRNHVPNMKLDGIVTDLTNQYGAEKYKAIHDILDDMPNRMSNSVFDTYTQGYNNADFNDAMKGIVQSSGKTSQRADVGKTVAQYARKLSGVNGERAVVHDNIRRAWNVADTTIKADLTSAMALGKNFPRKDKRKLDELLLKKHQVASASEMTTSTNQFIKNAFLHKNGKVTQFAFSMNPKKIQSIAESMRNVEVPFGNEGETFKFGDVFTINMTPITNTKLGQEGAFLDISFKKDNKYMTNDDFLETAEFFRHAEDGASSYFDGEKTITKNEVFNRIENSLITTMNSKFPDIFAKTGRINLIDEDMIQTIHKNADKEIEKLKGHLNKEDVTAYINNHTNLMAKIDSHAESVMNAMDNSGKLFENSELKSYFDTMKKRVPDAGDDTSVLIPSMRNTNVRTFITSKVTKQMKKDVNLMTDDPDLAGRSIVKDASIKGTYDAKEELLASKYGNDSNAIVTDLESYINQTTASNLEAITRSAYANNLAKFVKGTKRGGAKKTKALSKDVEVNLSDLENGIFKHMPGAFNKFKQDLAKTHNMPLHETDNTVVFKRSDYNQLINMGVQLHNVSDMSEIGKITKKISGFSRRSMLMGTFNAKMLMSTIPNLIMTPGGKGLDAVNDLYNYARSGRAFNRRIGKTPHKYLPLLQEVSSSGAKSYEELSNIGAKYLNGADLDAWNNRNKFDILRESSSKNINFNRHKKMNGSWRDQVEFDMGTEATMSDMIGATARGVWKNGIMPNMNVTNAAVLSRASYLVDHPNVLNKLMKSNYSEELIKDYDFQDLASNAMRLAESEFGVTDGILNSHDSWLDSLFVFRHQIVSGIPNILATYFGTPEGLLSTMQMQRRFNQIGAASAGMSQSEYNDNLSDEDYGRLVLGGNIGDTTKLISLNSYSPLDIITQYASPNNTPMKIFYDSMSPFIKYPLEMGVGHELGNYQTNGSNAEKFNNAIKTGDIKTAATHMFLGGLEASTGNLYRWSNQIHKLLSGKDNSGKQLLYFPTSTDAEINAVRSVANQYGDVSLKDGYIDEIPFISTLLNSHNASEDTATEGVVNALQEVAYNDSYMDALGDYETNPNGANVRNGIYNTIDNYSQHAVVMSGADLTDEYISVIKAIRSGNKSDLKQAYNDTKKKKEQAATDYMNNIKKGLNGE